jgi:alpha-tubulin suppressor-like RCC1 family protein
MFGCRVSVKVPNSGGDAGNTPAPSVPAPSVPQPHHLHEPSVTTFIINGQSWPLQVHIRDQSNNVTPVDHAIEIAAYANNSCIGPKQGQFTLGSTTGDTITVSANNGIVNLASITYTDNTNGRIWLSIKDTTDSSVTGICQELAIQEPTAQKLVFLNAQNIYTPSLWTPALQIAVQDSSSVQVNSSKAPVSLKAYSDAMCTTEITSGFNPGGDPILAVNGLATFNNISDTIPNAFYIKATSPGLTSTNCHRVNHFISVSVGYSHTCGIIRGGALYCWGLNSSGQLGDGSTANSANPVPVVGMSSGVTAVALGDYHTCAIQSGSLKCWGYNGYGQFGNGSTANSAHPVLVSGMGSDVTAVTAGGNHTCAIQGGALKCWGANGNGQLGDNTTTNRNTPVSVVSMSSNVTAVAGGLNHTCAIQSGALYCWGYNIYGQLGDNTNTQRKTPVSVIGMGSNVTVVTGGGNHTCAIQSGALYCWGWNAYGQLGNGNMTNYYTPQSVSGMNSSVTTVEAGKDHTCAIQSGALKCWGYNLVGQVGDGTAVNRTIPVSVSSMSSDVTVTAGGYFHTCAIQSGSLKCWGYNGYGQFGNGALANSNTPVLVSPTP